MPQSAPSEATVLVGGIFPPSDAAAIQVLQDFGARYVEQRPDDSRFADGPDAAQAAARGTSQEPKENGLGLVGLGVSRRDDAASAVGDRRAEELVAPLAPALLLIACRFRACLIGADPANEKLAVKLLGDATHKALVLVRLRTAPAVIHVQDRESPRFVQRAKCAKQSHRVRAAGHGDTDGAAWR